MAAPSVFRIFVFLSVLLVTLGFGWWPFNFSPPNDVSLVEEDGALSFNTSRKTTDKKAVGLAFIERPLQIEVASGSTISIELKARSNGYRLGVFLEFFDDTSEGVLPALMIAQWQEHLAMRSRRDRSEVSRGYSEIGVRDMFAGEEFVRLTVTSNGHRTHVLLNDELVEVRSGFPLLGPEGGFKGRVAIGNAADGTRPFTGEIRSLKIYDRFFYKASADEISKSVPLYHFDARNASVSAEGMPELEGLSIPPHLEVAKRSFFNPVGDANWEKPGYRSDVMVNVLGFLPIGLCFAAFSRRRRWGFFGTFLFVAVGSMLFSLTIEWGQGYLVNRDSSQLDVLLNTVSGTLAVLAPKRWLR